MSTITAQILVGQAHPYHGGIMPSHFLFLSENSRPGWVLTEANLYDSERETKRVVWIPTVEHMLEDAFLMTAVHVMKNKNVVALASSFSPNACSGRLELYEDFGPPQRDQLYAACRAIPAFPKMILSVFQGSSLWTHLDVVSRYRLEAEICRSTASR